jgi:hypothetical protein
MLLERKTRLEKTKEDLKSEHADLDAHIQSVIRTDDQIDDIKSFCEIVRDGLNAVTFEEKRRIIDLLDVRGKLAVENGEKVIYLRCVIDQQRLSVVQTLPWLNNHNCLQFILSTRLILNQIALTYKGKNALVI